MWYAHGLVDVVKILQDLSHKKVGNSVGVRALEKSASFGEHMRGW